MALAVLTKRFRNRLDQYGFPKLCESRYECPTADILNHVEPAFAVHMLHSDALFCACARVAQQIIAFYYELDKPEQTRDMWPACYYDIELPDSWYGCFTRDVMHEALKLYPEANRWVLAKILGGEYTKLTPGQKNAYRRKAKDNRLILRGLSKAKIKNRPSPEKGIPERNLERRDQSPKIQIFIKLPTCRSIVLCLSRYTTVEVVKNMIFEKERFPPIEQSLYFKGEHLVNNTTLDDNNIAKVSTLHLVVSKKEMSEAADRIAALTAAEIPAPAATRSAFPTAKRKSREEPAKAAPSSITASLKRAALKVATRPGQDPTVAAEAYAARAAAGLVHFPTPQSIIADTMLAFQIAKNDLDFNEKCHPHFYPGDVPRQQRTLVINFEEKINPKSTTPRMGIPKRASEATQLAALKTMNTIANYAYMVISSGVDKVDLLPMLHPDLTSTDFMLIWMACADRAGRFSFEQTRRAIKFLARSMEIGPKPLEKCPLIHLFISRRIEECMKDLKRMQSPEDGMLQTIAAKLRSSANADALTAAIEESVPSLMDLVANLRAFETEYRQDPAFQRDCSPWLGDTPNVQRPPTGLTSDLPYRGQAIFFHKEGETDGYLSNYYPTHLAMIGGFQASDLIPIPFRDYPYNLLPLTSGFSSSEHAFMYMKASAFGDVKTMQRIQSAVKPGDAKRLGRKIKGFIHRMWGYISTSAMTAAIMAKFDDPTLGQKLQETWPKALFEASPRDNAWGIGISAEDALSEDTTIFPGKNKLGMCLHFARAKLIAGAGAPMGEVNTIHDVRKFIANIGDLDIQHAKRVKTEAQTKAATAARAQPSDADLAQISERAASRLSGGMSQPHANRHGGGPVGGPTIAMSDAAAPGMPRTLPIRSSGLHRALSLGLMSPRDLRNRTMALIRRQIDSHRTLDLPAGADALHPLPSASGREHTSDQELQVLAPNDYVVLRAPYNADTTGLHIWECLTDSSVVDGAFLEDLWLYRIPPSTPSRPTLPVEGVLFADFDTMDVVDGYEVIVTRSATAPALLPTLFLRKQPPRALLSADRDGEAEGMALETPAAGPPLFLRTTSALPAAPNPGQASGAPPTAPSQEAPDEAPLQPDSSGDSIGPGPGGPDTSWAAKEIFKDVQSAHDRDSARELDMLVNQGHEHKEPGQDALAPVMSSKPPVTAEDSDAAIALLCEERGLAVHKERNVNLDNLVDHDMPSTRHALHPPPGEMDPERATAIELDERDCDISAYLIFIEDRVILTNACKVSWAKGSVPHHYTPPPPQSHREEWRRLSKAEQRGYQQRAADIYAYVTAKRTAEHRQQVAERARLDPEPRHNLGSPRKRSAPTETSRPSKYQAGQRPQPKERYPTNRTAILNIPGYHNQEIQSLYDRVAGKDKIDWESVLTSTENQTLNEYDHAVMLEEWDAKVLTTSLFDSGKYTGDRDRDFGHLHTEGILPCGYLQEAARRQATQTAQQGLGAQPQQPRTAQQSESAVIGSGIHARIAAQTKLLASAKTLSTLQATVTPAKKTGDKGAINSPSKYSPIRSRGSPSAQQLALLRRDNEASAAPPSPSTPRGARAPPSAAMRQGTNINSGPRPLPRLQSTRTPHTPQLNSTAKPPKPDARPLPRLAGGRKVRPPTGKVAQADMKAARQPAHEASVGDFTRPFSGESLSNALAVNHGAPVASAAAKRPKIATELSDQSSPSLRAAQTRATAKSTPTDSQLPSDEWVLIPAEHTEEPTLNGGHEWTASALASNQHAQQQDQALDSESDSSEQTGSQSPVLAVQQQPQLPHAPDTDEHGPRSNSQSPTNIRSISLQHASAHAAASRAAQQQQPAVEAPALTTITADVPHPPAAPASIETTQPIAGQLPATAPSSAPATAPPARSENPVNMRSGAGRTRKAKVCKSAAASAELGQPQFAKSGAAQATIRRPSAPTPEAKPVKFSAGAPNMPAPASAAPSPGGGSHATPDGSGSQARATTRSRPLEPRLLIPPTLEAAEAGGAAPGVLGPLGPPKIALAEVNSTVSQGGVQEVTILVPPIGTELANSAALHTEATAAKGDRAAADGTALGATASAPTQPAGTASASAAAAGDLAQLQDDASASGTSVSVFHPAAADSEIRPAAAAGQIPTTASGSADSTAIPDRLTQKLGPNLGITNLRVPPSRAIIGTSASSEKLRRTANASGPVSVEQGKIERSLDYMRSYKRPNVLAPPKAEFPYYPFRAVGADVLYLSTDGILRQAEIQDPANQLPLALASSIEFYSLLRFANCGTKKFSHKHRIVTFNVKLNGRPHNVPASLLKHRDGACKDDANCIFCIQGDPDPVAAARRPETREQAQAKPVASSLSAQIKAGRDKLAANLPDENAIRAAEARLKLAQHATKIAASAVVRIERVEQARAAMASRPKDSSEPDRATLPIPDLSLHSSGISVSGRESQVTDPLAPSDEADPSVGPTPAQCHDDEATAIGAFARESYAAISLANNNADLNAMGDLVAKAYRALPPADKLAFERRAQACEAAKRLVTQASEPPIAPVDAEWRSIAPASLTQATIDAEEALCDTMYQAEDGFFRLARSHSARDSDFNMKAFETLVSFPPHYMWKYPDMWGGKPMAALYRTNFSCTGPIDGRVNTQHGMNSPTKQVSAPGHDERREKQAMVCTRGAARTTLKQPAPKMSFELMAVTKDGTWQYASTFIKPYRLLKHGTLPLKPGHIWIRWKNSYLYQCPLNQIADLDETMIGKFHRPAGELAPSRQSHICTGRG